MCSKLVVVNEIARAGPWGFGSGLDAISKPLEKVRVWSRFWGLGWGLTTYPKGPCAHIVIYHIRRLSCSSFFRYVRAKAYTIWAHDL